MHIGQLSKQEMEQVEQNSSSQRNFLSFGQLQPLLDDPSIEEIWINSPNRIFLARAGRSFLAPLRMTAAEIRDVTERMLAWSGRRVDLSQPFVDARLPSGARLHVVIPDITAEFWTLNIRKRSLLAFTLSDLVKAQALTSEISELIERFIGVQVNILVSGATQAGKTTVLNCLLGSLPSDSRLVTLEEVFELNPSVADHVALQTRQASLDGAGEVTLRTLVRESLRMRPTNLVIGEVRGAEALDLLLALNSGIPGMASIHSNSATDALRKLSALPLLAGANINREFANEAVRENIDLIIHCKQDKSGHRRIAELAIVDKHAAQGKLQVEAIASWCDSQYEIHTINCDNFPQFPWLASILRSLQVRAASSTVKENSIKERM